MHERVRLVTHYGKQIVVLDLSHCPARDVETIVRSVPEYVTTQPLGSVLLLSDFTGASFDDEAMRVIKETAVFNKLHIKKSAWVGAESLPEVFQQNIKSFSRREFSKFRNRLEALDWLAAD